MWQRLAILLFLLLSFSWAQAAPTTPTTDFIDNQDGTVTHKITGLTWKRCSEGQTWSSGVCTGTAQVYTWNQAMALVASFAGKSDWRLPTVRELSTIFEMDAAPAINSTIFPNTPAVLFWSASAYVGNSDYAWYFASYFGLDGYFDKANYSYVRLVRGGQPLGLLALSRPTVDYVDNGDGTVTHTPTALHWKRCAEGQTYDATNGCTGTALTATLAQATALTSNYGGHTDWRLPTIAELRSLVDFTHRVPSINNTIFPNTSASYFWSASAYAGISDSAWSVSFDGGDDNYRFKPDGCYVRLVRGSQLAPIPIKMVIDGPDTLMTGNSATYSSASVTMSDGSSKKVSTLNWICSPGALLLGYDMAQSRPYNTERSAGIGFNVYSCLAGDMLTLHAGSQNGDDSYTIRATYTENGVQIVADKIIAIKAVMMGLAATCPSTINAGAGDSCSATASYSNDSSKAASASWSSSNPTVLSVNSSGSLTAGTPVSDTPVTITANYSEGGVSKSATATVTVKGAPPPPFILTLICPFTMNAGSTASCSAMVGYANSTSNTVSASWSSNNPSVLGVNGGTLTAGNVTTDTPVTLTAGYTENGVTKTATCTVTVKAAPPPFSLSISGVISLSSGQSASLSATAIYTNGTSRNVTGNVTWGLIGTGATIDAAGTITAQNVAADTSITVTASYSENGQPPQTAKKEITVQAAITLTGLELACPAGMTANSSGNCSAMAVYSDGKKTAVTSSTWSVSPSSAATIDASGKVTAAKVTADTPITVKASYTENGKTVSDYKSITLQAAPCLANTGEISISGAPVKKLGESLDVRYRLCNFNSATKFDVYVAVQIPDEKMFFLSTSGFFGVPTFTLRDDESKPPAYLANTLVPDLEGAVLSLPVMPLTLPTGTYTFYAIPVLTGKDVMKGFNWVGSMAKSEVSLIK